jgi:hypothetical protein
MANKQGYLRTNWRQTGQNLQVDAIGRAIPQGSGFAGSGNSPKMPNGGFIYNIVNHALGASVAVHNGVYSLGADSVLASMYGVDGFGGIGYKILPIGIFPRGISASGGGGTSALNIIASITTSDDSTIRFYCQMATLTNDNHASYFSATWHWTGFIVSTP